MAGPESTFIQVFLGVIGACVGSFINVVAFRLPRECMSLSRPRSRCPRCAAPIRWHENIPVLSWLILRGRCRACGCSISPRYPLVEALTALLFVLTARLMLPAGAFEAPLDHGQEWLRVGLACVITAALLVLSLIDLDYRILPDEITKSGIVLGSLMAFLAPGLQPTPVIGGFFPEGASPRVVALVHGLLGAATGMGALWTIGYLGSKAFRKPAMGLGDVKMIGAMGAVLGFWVFLALAVAAVAGGLIGGVLRLVAGARYIPFGPFLALGMWSVMVGGEPILRFYLGLVTRT